jgi:hypothetical protein
MNLEENRMQPIESAGGGAISCKEILEVAAAGRNQS